MVQVPCSNGYFGHYGAHCPGGCEWLESCKLCTSTEPERDNQTSHAVCYEQAENLIHRAAVSEECEFGAFASRLTYLLSLDDKTFAFVCDVIEYPGIQQSELARRRGVSRQRINTALLHSCRQHPELVPLFKLCVGRRTMERNRYARRNVALASTPDLPGMTD